MSSVWSRITKLFPTLGGRRFVGKDLEGNKYYEFPNPQGGRLRRVVKYRIMSQLSDYTSGRHKLPIQWTAWLSYTRQTPPTLSELQTDASRQSRLSPMIAAIEERERNERIRQGYISSDSPAQIHSGYGTRGRRGIPGGGGNGSSRINSTPSFGSIQPPPASIPSSSQSYPSTPTAAPSSSTSQSRGQFEQDFPQSSPAQPSSLTYPVPTPPSTPVPPPPSTVDPSLYDTKGDLRRLAEEDTKRRMAQTAELPKPAEEGAKAGFGAPGGLQPRRRGKG